MALILVVDDHAENITVAEKLLQRIGHEIISSLTAEAGIELAIEHAPDLILMDIWMPNMDGWEAIDNLKSNPQTQGIPIIAVSAAGTYDYRQRALDAGCVDYVVRPFMPAEMERVIERHLT